MSLHPLFTLGERLQLCASMVRSGCALADIGTDHAYLPIWLARQGLIARAVAADVKEGPLQKAQFHIERYDVQDMVSARLSDGLDSISPMEADDIVIAGMGGETMIQIISKALWLKDQNKHLILQPMTTVQPLRVFLAEQGFAVLREQAVQQDGHVYSAFLAVYEPDMAEPGALYPYIGKLDAATEESRLYIRHCAETLGKKANGLALSGKEEEAAPLRAVIERLNAMLKEEEAR